MSHVFRWDLGGNKVYLVLQELEGDTVKQKMIQKQSVYGDIVFEVEMVSIKFISTA